MNTRLSLANILGPAGPGVTAAMRAGLAFLDREGPDSLLRQTGQTIEEIPDFSAIDKSALTDSYGGNRPGPSDDFLVGGGLFYLDERRRLFLDCTSGHYQMLWGYNHPDLCDAVQAATREGVIWDNHSNIPQAPLKRLSHRLVEFGNEPGETDPLDTVLLGVCTGSVACAAALKIQLKVFEREHGSQAVPVLMVLSGNYHGTDMVPQFMRGMWTGMLPRFELVQLEPNQPEALEAAFKKHGTQVAGFWAEPIMMNREAIGVDPDYLKLAERWCRETGALLCVDEIQTGFWQPEVFEYRRLGLRPDLVILGKGMTAGYHPLSGVLMRHRHDVLEQYDAISTNGSASMPALVALCSLELLEEQADRIRKVGHRIHEEIKSLAAEFPRSLLGAHGRGHLTGLKFRRVDEAQRFHRELLEAGLWTRVHAYHAGHSTILTKLGLLADDAVIDFVLASFRRLMRNQETKPSRA